MQYIDAACSYACLDVAWSVCLPVCWLVGHMGKLCKNAEVIEILLWGRGGADSRRPKEQHTTMFYMGGLDTP